MSNLKNYLFTSESVSEGHPDKVSDRISDMVVDSFISRDPIYINQLVFQQLLMD